MYGETASAPLLSRSCSLKRNNRFKAQGTRDKEQGKRHKISTLSLEPFTLNLAPLLQLQIIATDADIGIGLERFQELPECGNRLHALQFLPYRPDIIGSQ